MPDAAPRSPHRADARPFFVVGQRHSGADRLQRLLAGHPQIALSHEAGLVSALCFCFEYCSLPAGRVSVDSGVQGVVHPDAIPTFAPILLEHSKQMLEGYYARAFDKAFTRWGDTMHEPGWAMLMQRVFPGVQYVVLVRDPRDVVCARRGHGVRAGAAFDAWASVPVDEDAEGWRSTYEYLHGAEAPKCVVTYEQLVADPAATGRRVLEFLGLEEHASVERAAAEVASAKEPGASPGAPAGVGRWRKELTPADARAVEQRCGAVMRVYGYA